MVKAAGPIGLIVGGVFTLFFWVMTLISLTPGWVNTYDGWFNPEVAYFIYVAIGTGWYLIFFLAALIMRFCFSNKEADAKVDRYIVLFALFFFIYFVMLLLNIGVAWTKDYEALIYGGILVRPSIDAASLNGALTVPALIFKLNKVRINDEFFANWMAILAKNLIASGFIVMISIAFRLMPQSKVLNPLRPSLEKKISKKQKPNY